MNSEQLMDDILVSHDDSHEMKKVGCNMDTNTKANLDAQHEQLVAKLDRTVSIEDTEFGRKVEIKL